MIADALIFLKNRLNAYFSSLNDDAGSALADKVVFINGDQKAEGISFNLGAVSMLLFNIEREVVNRQADQYKRVSDDGSARKVSPEITIYLYIMFVAKFKDYDQSLHYLSLILSYFQANSYFDRQNAPEISQSLGHLVLELISQTPSQQNETWGMLRSSYLPSLVYRVKALTFSDAGQVPMALIDDIELNQRQI